MMFISTRQSRHASDIHLPLQGRKKGKNIRRYPPNLAEVAVPQAMWSLFKLREVIL